MRLEKSSKRSNLNIKFLVNHINSGKKPISACKILNISPQLLSYYLKVLKRKGMIRNISKGVWRLVQTLPKDHSKKNDFRGHAFIWNIQLPKNLKNWNKRKEILKKLDIPYVHAGNTIRIYIRGKKVWLNNKGMTIYEPKSFFATTPLESRKLAVYELSEVIKEIQSKLRINIPRWKFSLKREHIAKVKDLLAIQCNKEGERLKIIDKGETWMEIDNSHNVDETEFYKTKSFSGLINATGYKGYYNSHKDTHWKVTPEFVLNTMDGIQQNQLIFAKNMESHIDAIKILGREMKGLSKAIKSVKKENTKLKLGNQKTILDF